jgi:hypothetical protein
MYSSPIGEGVTEGPAELGAGDGIAGDVGLSACVKVRYLTELLTRKYDLPVRHREGEPSSIFSLQLMAE